MTVLRAVSSVVQQQLLEGSPQTGASLHRPSQREHWALLKEICTITKHGRLHLGDCERGRYLTVTAIGCCGLLKDCFVVIT